MVMIVIMEMIMLKVSIVLLLVLLIVRIYDNNNGAGSVPYLFLHFQYLTQSRDFKIFVEGWNKQSVSLLKGNTELAILHVQHPPVDFHFININTHLYCLGLCILLLLWYHPELYCYCSLDTLASLLFFRQSYMFPSQVLCTYSPICWNVFSPTSLVAHSFTFSNFCSNVPFSKRFLLTTMYKKASPLLPSHVPLSGAMS